MPFSRTGTVKKRSGRLLQWTTRFFILDSKTFTLSYKLKNDPNAQPRAMFEQESSRKAAAEAEKSQ
jgi:hypothetical protein